MPPRRPRLPRSSRRRHGTRLPSHRRRRRATPRRQRLAVDVRRDPDAASQRAHAGPREARAHVMAHAPLLLRHAQRRRRASVRPTRTSSAESEDAVAALLEHLSRLGRDRHPRPAAEALADEPAVARASRHRLPGGLLGVAERDQPSTSVSCQTLPPRGITYSPSTVSRTERAAGGPTLRRRQRARAAARLGDARAHPSTSTHERRARVAGRAAGEEADSPAAPDERVHQLDDPARARRRLRMPVDEARAERVHLVGVDPELAREPDVVDGERVVRLDHVDLVDADARRPPARRARQARAPSASRPARPARSRSSADARPGRRRRARHDRRRGHDHPGGSRRRGGSACRS